MDWATLGVDLHLDLDATGGRRAGLERALRDAIRDGRLTPGARLPATRALAGELNLSRGTVSAAYDQLVAEGWLTARIGCGTTVNALPAATARPAAPARGPVTPRYDLRPGSPDVGAFPVPAWLRATRRALAAAPASVYGYGDPRGRVELRSALAGYLGRTWRSPGSAPTGSGRTADRAGSWSGTPPHPRRPTRPRSTRSRAPSAPPDGPRAPGTDRSRAPSAPPDGPRAPLRTA
ncbi:GntR family transcriptional regulator [Micromonospora costi]|uniref:GntR family transcriptional regulator n=1 Tax=Micromonospora costi TaxID=1530042 RepID=UPI0033E88E81